MLCDKLIAFLHCSYLKIYRDPRSNGNSKDKKLATKCYNFVDGYLVPVGCDLHYIHSTSFFLFLCLLLDHY